MSYARRYGAIFPEDIAQEAILHARDRRDQLRDESKDGAWLRRIAARRTFEYLRHRRLEESAEPVAAFVPVDPGIAGASGGWFFLQEETATSAKADSTRSDLA